MTPQSMRPVVNSRPVVINGRRNRTASGIVCLALLALALLPATSVAGKKPKNPKKIDAALSNSFEHGALGSMPVIVRTNAGRQSVFAARLQRSGKPVDANLALVGGLALNASLDEVADLADDPDVNSVSLDAPVSSFAAKAPRWARVTRNDIVALRATLGLTETRWTGANVGVAVIDSGIGDSDALKGRVTAAFTVKKGTVRRNRLSTDDFGHGTHVAGLIGAGPEFTNGQYGGLASGVNLIQFRVLNKKGAGLTSDVILALEYTMTHRRRLRIDVINLSLGHPIYEPASRDPLVQAVEAAVRSGLVVVVSAGNYGARRDGTTGYAGITSPGNAPSAITVGALMTRDTITRTDDVVAPYSSRGPTWKDGYAKPDIVAPGHDLVSETDTASELYAQLRIKQGVQSRNQRAMLKLSGTSMATAVTSGVVALMIEAHRATDPQGPDLTPNAIKAMLEFTAVDVRDELGVPIDALTRGAGGLDAGGAVALATAISTTVPASASWLVTGVTPSTSIGGQGTALVAEPRVGRHHRVGRLGLHERPRLGAQHRVG